MGRQVAAEDLGHVLLERGVHGPGRVDFADGQVGGRLFADQDVDAVVLLLADGYHKPKQQFVMWSYGR